MMGLQIVCCLCKHDPHCIPGALFAGKARELSLATLESAAVLVHSKTDLRTLRLLTVAYNSSLFISGLGDTVVDR
eukprot:4866924-Amphidinium_carterae.2